MIKSVVGSVMKLIKPHLCVDMAMQFAVIDVMVMVTRLKCVLFTRGVAKKRVPIKGVNRMVSRA